MRGRGIVVGMLGAFAVLASLTACSGLTGAANATDWTTTAGATIGAQALQHPSEPATGDCWNLSYADVVAEPSYPLGSQVSCSSPHQSYTFAIISIVSDSSGESSTQSQSDEVSDGQLGCATQFAALFPAESANHQNRVLFEAFMSAGEVAANGQHWARCDLEELAVGSNFFDPTLANLPDFTTLKTDLQEHAADYALRANTPGSTGSTGPNIGSTTTVADCTTAQWRLESGTDTFPQPLGTPYPGYAGLYPFMHAHCGAIYDSATIRGWDLFPGETQWSSGDRTFSCWIGHR